ncbi:hypothetical protein DPMN_022318 [Dreissena polymorpha]|uniref:Uncharacterized protein n=1 Tax=Dreissena polymorpha TaxID=45954 RepID=A0A9D4NMC0_DREPO|nr:hypothetical protein DPMN_022318 [Dreissena polymorpha]
MTEQNSTEQCRAQLNRTVQSRNDYKRTAQSRTDQCRGEHTSGEQCWTPLCRTEKSMGSRQQTSAHERQAEQGR